jgi:hypothetical protein
VIKRKVQLGQVLVLATMSLLVLTGFTVLAVDVGFLLTERRHMQTAADAAAIAGATALRYNQSYAAAATGTSTLNGFSDGQKGVTVTVNNPPSSGPYSSDSNYVEVVVKKPEPTYFLRVTGYNTMNVSARAVASSVTSPICIYALDPSASGVLHTDGGDNITSTCGLIVNSSNATAITSGGNIIAPSVGMVGGYSGTITSSNVRTGIAAVGDPLAYLQAPAIGSCNATYPSGFNKSSGAWTLSAGTYCGGITVSGSASLTLNLGTYVLKGGGLNLAGNAVLTGTGGVTFYNTGTSSTYKPITMTNDSGSVNLAAPTTGPLAGILFFQDRAIISTAVNLIGGGNAQYQGAFYFPTTEIQLSQGSAVPAAYTIIVAKRIGVFVNTFAIANDYSSLAKGSPIKSTALYE